MATAINTTIRAFQTVTIEEACEHLAELNKRAGVIPADAHDHIAAAMETLCSSAAALGIESLGAFCASASLLIQHASRVSNPNAFHNSADADRLHLHRNLALTIALAAAYFLDIDAPPVVQHFPKLKPRSAWPDRPHTDDETVLMRVYVATLLRERRHYQAAAVYALVDAGATPAESTTITADDVIDSEHVLEYVLVPRSNRLIEDRFLTLDQFHNHVLRPLIDAHTASGRTAGTPLAYRPRKEDPHPSAAAATSSGVINRMQQMLGIKHADITAASPRRWRIALTQRVHGDHTATHVAGVPIERLAILTREQPTPAPLAQPSVRSFI